ncbi:MAG: Glutamate-tRNA ligase [candidate division TM6 bacterium GW2011_GWF2_38_10]|nr:MAG: Glutamate-tRNA ligase [candidate division TM6 bacterium GW2011_GWF2_38_10]
MNQRGNKIRVRFAPSPTGHLHIGGLRSALFNWLFARHNQGTFVIRIEDTDQLRSTKEFEQSIIQSLLTMSLPSDEPIVYQHQRLDAHRQAAQYLLDKGLAYPCFCQPKNADTVINDLEEGKGSVYDRTCRDKSYTQEDLKRPHALRFKVPDTLNTVYFDDLVLGRIEVAASHLDDFVIMRQDNTPTYNFCVVVDDIFMGITHIIRGQDHVSNTAKQILLYQAYQQPRPYYAHIPLILGPTGGKLSKRDTSVSVQEYIEQGYLPAALCNYLVRLGWAHNDQEVFTRKEMIDLFTLDAVGKKGAIFDIKKLQWLNSLYIRQASLDDLIDALNTMSSEAYTKLTSRWDQAQCAALLKLYQQRALTLRELYNDIYHLAQRPSTCNTNILTKWMTDQTPRLVQAYKNILEHQTSWTADNLQTEATNACLQYNAKLVTLAQPLRLALTGGVTSPGIFEIMEILGKDKVLARLSLLKW